LEKVLEFLGDFLVDLVAEGDVEDVEAWGGEMEIEFVEVWEGEGYLTVFGLQVLGFVG
jgi:hypothetical protein